MLRLTFEAIVRERAMARTLTYTLGVRNGECCLVSMPCFVHLAGLDESQFFPTQSMGKRTLGAWERKMEKFQAYPV